MKSVARVAVIMGSKPDWKTMQHAVVLPKNKDVSPSSTPPPEFSFVSDNSR